MSDVISEIITSGTIASETNSEFTSDLITLNDVVNSRYFFNIPIYQRLYVWGKEQIHTLLDDIVEAYQEEKNEFYLGGTLVIERDKTKNDNGEDECLFDLIDGQQRFTTLWLISVVLEEKLQDYKQVKTAQGIRPRIGFAIRPKVTEFFQRVCKGEKDVSLSESLQLEDALQEIRSYFDNYKGTSKDEVQDKATDTIDKVKLSEFIRDKVQLILTRVPNNTDLNKLFEVINNRGVQLQHHEILKAKLLEVLPVDDRESYGQLWDVCSDMSSYVERHFKAVTKIDTVSLFEYKVPYSKLKREPIAFADSVLNQLLKKQKTTEKSSLNLLDILNEETDFEFESEEVNDEKDGSELPDRVTSIISFSMLLQHCLRIFLSKQKSDFPHADINKISDKDLLNVFKEFYFSPSLTSEHVRQYIKLLWEVRYIFDKNIIKWVMVEEDKVHEIRKLRVNAGYLQRESKDAKKSVSLLQSMLYHSQQMTTHYWLTPLLNFMLNNDEKDAELYLQHLDNHLLGSEAGETLIKRSQKFLQAPWHTESLIEADKAFNQQFTNGTKYPHYWFYKLEYVLYLKLKSSKHTEDNQLVNDFRMTAKNSVEHVGPQHPRLDKDKITAECLHDFGNLALVTRSLNSEMSDKGFGIKKAEFMSRYHRNGVCLKLEFIYKNDVWDKTEIEDHRKDMIQCFNQYLVDVKQKVINKKPDTKE